MKSKCQAFRLVLISDMDLTSFIWIILKVWSPFSLNVIFSQIIQILDRSISDQHRYPIFPPSVIVLTMNQVKRHFLVLRPSIIWILGFLCTKIQCELQLCDLEVENFIWENQSYSEEWIPAVLVKLSFLFCASVFEMEGASQQMDVIRWEWLLLLDRLHTNL